MRPYLHRQDLNLVDAFSGENINFDQTGDCRFSQIQSHLYIIEVAVVIFHVIALILTQEHASTLFCNNTGAKSVSHEEVHD